MAKMRVIVTPDGQVQVFVDEGTFAEAKPKIELILQALKVSGVKFTEVGQVEQHRHDENHIHVGTHTHGGTTHTH